MESMEHGAYADSSVSWSFSEIIGGDDQKETPPGCEFWWIAMIQDSNQFLYMFTKDGENFWAFQSCSCPTYVGNKPGFQPLDSS